MDTIGLIRATRNGNVVDGGGDPNYGIRHCVTNNVYNHKQQVKVDLTNQRKRRRIYSPTQLGIEETDVNDDDNGDGNGPYEPGDPAADEVTNHESTTHKSKQQVLITYGFSRTQHTYEKAALFLLSSFFFLLSSFFFLLSSFFFLLSSFFFLLSSFFFLLSSFFFLLSSFRQDRTGQDRTGQDRTGQDRTGQ